MSLHETALARKYLVPKILAEFKGIYFEKVYGTVYTPGHPDYYFFDRGQGGGLETKKWGEKLTPPQAKKIAGIRRGGGLALMVEIHPVSHAMRMHCYQEFFVLLTERFRRCLGAELVEDLEALVTAASAGPAGTSANKKRGARKGSSLIRTSKL